MPPRLRRFSASRLRAARALALVVWAASAGASGCFIASGPEPLDLSVSQGKITDDSERLVNIRQVMERDLAQLEASRKSFESTPTDLYRAPFPLDLFKYVAVLCFNEPYDMRPAKRAAPQVDEGAKEIENEIEKLGDWTCEPEYAGRLMVALHEHVPQHQAAAMHQLTELDRLRQSRAKLLFRLGQLPGVLREMRQLLATRRADLRRMRAAEARRRTEYRGSDWEEMERRFDRFEQELTGLSQEIERLAKVTPSWKPLVEAQIVALYAHLTSLTAPPLTKTPE